MSTGWKLLAGIILAAIYGYVTFDLVSRGEYAFYAVGTVIPFLVCVFFVLQQSIKLGKEKRN
jgi:uncharacterized membrane protein YgaE (UPF0421/DUF939 family)